MTIDVDQRPNINKSIDQPHARGFHRPATIAWKGASIIECAGSESARSAEPRAMVE